MTELARIFAFLSIIVMLLSSCSDEVPRKHGDIIEVESRIWDTAIEVVLHGDEEWEYRFDHNNLMNTANSTIMAFEAEKGPNSITVAHSFRDVAINEFVEQPEYVGIYELDGSSKLTFKSTEDQLVRIASKIVPRGSSTQAQRSEGYRANLCATFGCEDSMRSLDDVHLDFFETMQQALSGVLAITFLMALLFFFSLAKSSELADDKNSDEVEGDALDREKMKKREKVMSDYEEALAQAQKHKDELDRLDDD